MKKKPPVEISKAEMEYLGTLRERDRRHFIACKASGSNGSSIKAVCEAFRCSPNTVSKALFELMNHIVLPDGRQRMPGGGAKRKTDKHPEWVEAFDDIVSGHKAGFRRPRASSGSTSPYRRYDDCSLNAGTTCPTTSSGKCLPPRDSNAGLSSRACL